MNPLRFGFRVCDRRYSFWWQSAGQRACRWKRDGDETIHYLANTPTAAWAEWIRHQESEDPDDLAGVAASLWTVLMPDHWSEQNLQPVNLSMKLVLGTTPEAAKPRLSLVDQLKAQGAQCLLASSAAPYHSCQLPPCSRVYVGSNQADQLLMPAQVLLLWCAAEQLPCWCSGSEGRPEPELVHLVRRQGMLRA